MGRGVTQDFAEAIRWYRKAAEQGSADAQYSLGSVYYIGQQVKRDYAEASHWYRKAAEQGDPDAQSKLGTLYDEGQGVPQDYLEALMWTSLAASRARGDQQKQYADQRNELARKMTPQQIAEAQRRAREWTPKTERESKEPAQK